ncbi:MAG: NAD-dependent epimerase/dehydratase family protein [Chloroflexi bacterium]|nr:NAD-dependent epimerase/dehydratase family protein [Chloroflexota bacterium]
MKALVTGATGFIGGNLARELLAGGAEVRALTRPKGDRRAIEGLNVEVAEGDLLDKGSLGRAMAGCDTVFHVGAVYAFWPPNHELIYRTNVEGTTNVLAAAKAQGVRQVVHTSSCSTVGIRKDKQPADETAQAGSDDRIKGYKDSKYLAEQAAMRCAKEGMRVVVVNPTTPIGPWDVKPTPTGRIVVDFLKGRMFGYLNTGLNLVHVRDVARGHILAAEKGHSGERYLLGNRNMMLKEVFAALGQITGRRPPKLRVPYAAALGFAYVDELIEGRLLRKRPTAAVGEVKLSRKHMYFDGSKAVRELGMPQTPVEEALKESVHWFKAHGYV